ncbi:MAG TPA: preprotein translocase subunit SecA [Candidatus Magasanikbacteria bacterium]|nr:preprotein translocase subunit SecA [Candidatus Magasanikbacteria bacterium]
MSFLHKFFPDQNKKTVKALQPLVERINSFEPEFEKLSNDEVKAKTAEFKSRLEKGETLDDILPEAFATVREAAKRTLGMRHYDVQLIGGITLHRGRIAEMRTGEGKTLTATLAVYLNALSGKGVHLVTVNDYLAKRDAVWMGQIYDFLGLTIGIVQNQRVSFAYDATAKATAEGSELDHERDEVGSFKVENEYLRPISRQEAYRCDITYGTNNEFGFDYLRDNMVQRIEDMVMRPGTEMNYAIVDEIDSILIDEARTPLIISAPAEEATDQYYRFADLVKMLVVNEDYNIDEKLRSATLTDLGIAKFEKWLNVDNLYVEGGIRTVHHIEQALKAEFLFKKDKDYIVDGQEIIIIDEFTGRKMPGRRYSEGLHQAIEAKEKMPIQKESRTLATITFQNLFRMYDKLGGMTGTAKTEEEEFFKIYGLEVTTIPTNKPDNRVDHSDRIYKNNKGKYKAIVEKVKEARAKGQPVLIGTISVEKNEELSAYLFSQGIEHEVLNAKNHEREGEIIAQAGRPGAVTLATNMAGRGVDIKLGGVPAVEEDVKKVVEAGGLFVLGTERHESRRIDNQLRGRSARQGDPGETQFFVSSEDDLMRVFAGDRLKSVMTRFNIPDDMPIEQKMITRILEGAQKKVESHHFDTRKHLLSYDDVLNKQRDVIYKKRREILDSAKREIDMVHADSVAPTEEAVQRKLREIILEMVDQEIETVVSIHTNSDDETTWNIKEINESMAAMMPLESSDKSAIESIIESATKENKNQIEVRNEIVEKLAAKARSVYDAFVASLEKMQSDPKARTQMMIELERGVLLRTIDMMWVDYLITIDHLRAGIGLQGYGQRDPLVEYKQESFHLFNRLLSGIQREVANTIFKIHAGIQLAPSVMATDKMSLDGAKKTSESEAAVVPSGAGKAVEGKIGRNDPCPCGSGKKYKKCHGV